VTGTTTIRIGTIRPAAGSTRPRKRRGKGSATGLGGTAGKGHKGHKARTGGKIPVWFEGGQMPAQRRLPKRGFKNPGRVEYQVVAIGRLAEAAAGTTVDREWLKRAGLARRQGPVKLLAGGDIKAALTVKVDAASASARRAIEAAGGRVETPAPAPGAERGRKKAKAKSEEGPKA
jgi:large subunit ribosomal protein L15